MVVFRPAASACVALLSLLKNSRDTSPATILFCSGEKNLGLTNPVTNKKVSQIATKEPVSVMERGERGRCNEMERERPINLMQQGPRLAKGYL